MYTEYTLRNFCKAAAKIWKLQQKGYYARGLVNKMAFLHKQLAAGGWYKLSLAEQLGNIGSEVSRVIRWQDKDENLFWAAIERALELFDLTLEDKRWKNRRWEIGRAREVFCDAVYGGKLYKSSFEDLLRYFDIFALAVRNQ